MMRTIDRAGTLAVYLDGLVGSRDVGALSRDLQFMRADALQARYTPEHLTPNRRI
jgi:hypothetical protein